MLAPQDLCGPPFPPDFPECADDRRIVGRTFEKIPQDPEADARVRILRKEPVAESAAQGHPHLGTGGPYLSPPGDRLRGARCDRVIWAEPFQRASRLSSAWSERVTVECSRARSVRGARCHHQAAGSNPAGGTSLSDSNGAGRNGFASCHATSAPRLGRPPPFRLPPRFRVARGRSARSNLLPASDRGRPV